jgi:large conductance mechanosensitive channel
MSGFKNFIMRGNLVELAVAVVIGTQFSNLVHQFVSSFVNPLLSLVGGTPDFSKLVLHVGKAKFTYGTFLTEVLTFLISALVVYYAMVMPVSRLLKLFERNRAATTRDCPQCTTEITPATERPQPVGSPAGGLAGRASARGVYRFPPGPRWPARLDGAPSRRPGARIRR